MRVRITDFTGMDLWYRNKIGKVFEVEEAVSDGWYRVVSSVKYIKAKDCQIIREEGVIGVDANSINIRVRIKYDTMHFKKGDIAEARKGKSGFYIVDGYPIYEDSLEIITTEIPLSSKVEEYATNNVFATVREAFIAGYEKGRESEVDRLREEHSTMYRYLQAKCSSTPYEIPPYIRSLITKIETNGK